MASFTAVQSHEGGELLLAASETFMQMATIAQLNDSNDDRKVFYSHLAFNCARMFHCLKASPLVRESLVRQALEYLNSLVPECGPHLPSYFSTTEDRLRLLKCHWESVKRQDNCTKLDFVSQWLRPKVSEEKLSAFDHDLEGCVDEIQSRLCIDKYNDFGVEFKDHNIGEPPFSVWKPAQLIFDALLNCNNCNNCTCPIPHDSGVKLELSTYRNPIKPMGPGAARLCAKYKAARGPGFDMFLSMERSWHEVRVHDFQKPRVGFDLPDEDILPLEERPASVSGGIETICAQITKSKSRPRQRLVLQLTGKQLFPLGFEKTNFQIDRKNRDISLAHYLEQRHQCFTEKTKRVLSLIIGSTVLQLGTTSWFRLGWGSSNIKFFQTSSGNVPLRPFIETQLDYGEAIDDDDLDSDHLCPPLISLAVVLIELYFVQPFKSLAELHSIQLNPNGRISLVDVDEVWTGVDEGEESLCEEMENGVTKKSNKGWRSQIPEDFTLLLNAIDNCLNSELWEDDRGDALDDQTLRSKIYQKIIRPLELHLTRGFSNIPLDGVDKHARGIDFSKWGEVITSQPPEERTAMLSQGIAISEQIQPPVNSTFASKVENQPKPHSMPSESYQKSHPCILASNSTSDVSTGATSSHFIDSAQFFDDEMGDTKETENYEKWKADYRDVYKKFIGSDFLSPPSKRVKIAILDTGVDEEHSIFDAHKSFMGRHNFYDKFHENETSDENGHGTFVTSLILDYAPDADIYIAKISGKDNVSPKAENVKRAIDYAVDEWKVDMISMSFGWPSSDFDGHEDLQAAIDGAYGKKILMFAAASNNGGNSGRAYPASSPHVICVHSTDARGNRSNFSPTQENDSINIATVGQSIRSAFAMSLCNVVSSQDCFISRSGTSYATPILAGIVAFLLQYARLHLRESDVLALRRKENVEALLKRCANRGPNYVPRDGYLYVELSMHKHNLFGGKPIDVKSEISKVLRNR